MVLLEDHSGFRLLGDIDFNGNRISGNTIISGSLSVANLSGNSVVFVDGAGLLTEDTSNFVFNNTTNILGIGTPTPALTGAFQGIELMNSGNGTEYRFTSYRTSSPRALIKGRSAGGTVASPIALVADGGEIFRIDGDGYNGTDFSRACEIHFQFGSGSISGSSTPGRITLDTSPNLTIATTEKMRIDPDGIVVNENSLDHDFRVESNNNANMFFVDGGTDRVGIGTASPQHHCDIFSSGELNLRVKKSGSGGVLIAGLTGKSAIYTDSSVPLHLGTNSTEQITIDTAGKMGIGTGTPLDTLDVRGRISGAQMFSNGGFTGTGIFTTLRFSGGLCISAV